MPEHLKYTEESTNEVLCRHCFDAMVAYDELIEHDQVTSCPCSMAVCKCVFGTGMSQGDGIVVQKQFKS